MTLRVAEAELAVAVELVQNAHKAFAAGELRSAEALHEAAERSCISLLVQVGQLEEREADAIETEFTRFEKLLTASQPSCCPTRATGKSNRRLRGPSS
jgi:hypothetical protein